jgi:hypothetical protein
MPQAGEERGGGHDICNSKGRGPHYLKQQEETRTREVVPYTNTRRLQTSKREKTQGGCTKKTKLKQGGLQQKIRPSELEEEE